MLGLSQATDYAILALACLDGPEAAHVLVRDIAWRSANPGPHLSKIIGSLAAKGLVTTKRGHRGGVILARRPTKISLFDIAVAIEGEQSMDRCLLGLDECRDNRGCPTHTLWQTTRGRIVHELERIPLHEAAEFKRTRALKTRTSARRKGQAVART